MLTKKNDHVMLTNRTYDISKNLVQLYIPAVSTLYFTLAAIWGLPMAEEVVGTLAALATFLGVVLKVSSNRYESSGADYDGDMIKMVDPESGDFTFRLVLNADPEELQQKPAIKFKVGEEHTPLP